MGQSTKAVIARKASKSIVGEKPAIVYKIREIR